MFNLPARDKCVISGRIRVLSTCMSFASDTTMYALAIEMIIYCVWSSLHRIRRKYV